jgi:hypothetical protein
MRNAGTPRARKAQPAHEDPVQCRDEVDAPVRDSLVTQHQFGGE